MVGGEAGHGHERIQAAQARDLARIVLARRLRLQGESIGEAIFARIRDERFGAAGSDDSEYTAGLRAAALAGLELALSAIESGDTRRVVAPAAALEQARRAARTGVGLDTVLRRYLAGYALLESCIAREVERDPRLQRGSVLSDALALVSEVIDCLTDAVSEAYLRQDRGLGGAPPSGPPSIVTNPTARRARACLRYLAEQGELGLSPSNAQIAAAVGVAHDSQISRLLSELAREGLLLRSSAGAGRRNSWRLSELGKGVAEGLG